MKNSAPLFFDNPVKNPKYISKKTDDSDGQMMFLTGKSLYRDSSGKPEIHIPLNMNSYNTIFLFSHGEYSLQIGLNHYELKPNDLVVIPERVRNNFSSPTENCGHCIYFRTEYLFPIFKISNIGDILPFMVNDAKYVLGLTSCQSKFIKVLFAEINQAYESSSKEKDNIIRCYIEILLLKCKEYFQEGLPTAHPQTNRSFALTRQFKSLVEKNFITIRIVSEYADILHVSPKHLEKTVKETLGITPKKLIHDNVLLEAKVLLKQTEKTVSEIACALKFEDQSYFSRFFKRHTLLTPQDYRTIV